jgi:hypothetical protein
MFLRWSSKRESIVKESKKKVKDGIQTSELKEAKSYSYHDALIDTQSYIM